MTSVIFLRLFESRGGGGGRWVRRMGALHRQPVSCPQLLLLSLFLLACLLPQAACKRGGEEEWESRAHHSRQVFSTGSGRDGGVAEDKMDQSGSPKRTGPARVGSLSGSAAAQTGVLGGGVVLASLLVQRAEQAALLRFMQALNSHPAFSSPQLKGFEDGDSSRGKSRGRAAKEVLGKGRGSGKSKDVAPWTNLTLPCGVPQWAWIVCNANQRVSEILLDSLTLAKANSSWSPFHALETEDGSNPLTGYIDWGSLSVLQELRVLRLSGNRITGNLTGMGLLRSLEIVDLGINMIGGRIPLGVSRLTNLLSLRLGENKLSGGLPPALAGMTRLTVLSLTKNDFQGQFPVALSALRRLAYLDLSLNRGLQGPLPALWSNLKALTRLQLGGTWPQGPFPASWTTLKALQFFDCASCRLTLPYPPFLTQLPRLHDIQLQDNNLYGALPSTVWAPPGLLVLDVSRNYLGGAVVVPLDQRQNSPFIVFNPALNCFANTLNVLPQRGSADCESFYNLLGKVPGVPKLPPYPPLPPSPPPRPPGSNQGSNWPPGVLPPFTSGDFPPGLAPSPTAEASAGPPPPPRGPTVINVGGDNGWTLPFNTSWVPPPIYVGDKLNFSSSSKSSNKLSPGVWQLLSAVAFTNCDFSLAIEVGQVSLVTKPFVRPGVYWYASAQDAVQQCWSGQKISITVLPSPLSPPSAFVPPPPFLAPPPYSAPPLPPAPSDSSSSAWIIAVSVVVPVVLLACLVATILLWCRLHARGDVEPEDDDGHTLGWKHKAALAATAAAAGSQGESSPPTSFGSDGSGKDPNGGAGAMGMVISTSNSGSGTPTGLGTGTGMGTGTGTGTGAGRGPRTRSGTGKGMGTPSGMRSGSRSSGSFGAGIEVQGARQFSLDELGEATDGFSSDRLLGKGSFGEVFYGELPSSNPGKAPHRVAVKRQLRGDMRVGPDMSFLNEIKILSGAYHRNLVSLRGYCWEKGQLLLVYDFVSKGSLDTLLKSSASVNISASSSSSNSNMNSAGSIAGSASSAAALFPSNSWYSSSNSSGLNEDVLTWERRLKLAVGAAQGLNFLHNEAPQPILHLDIKSGNILVDDNFQAKVADFGLSKIDLKASASEGMQTSRIRGTPGYVDPDCLKSWQLTDKSDVYSFGVVLLELATGWRPLEEVDGEPEHIAKRVVENVNKDGVLSVAAPAIRAALTESRRKAGLEECTGAMFTRFLCLGAWCTLHDRTKRPTMQQVLHVLMELEDGVEELGEEGKVLVGGQFDEQAYAFEGMQAIAWSIGTGTGQTFYPTVQVSPHQVVP